VFERLRNGPSPVGRLAEGLPVSRPAVSQHLKVLKEAGLVSEEQEGTRRIYRIDPHGLGQLRAWLDQFWEMALDAFKGRGRKIGQRGARQMTKTVSIAPVKKVLTVNAAQAHAFDVFTAGIDRWWPKSHSLGRTPMVKSVVEMRLGGRWYTVHEDGEECVVGHIRTWEPPHRLVVSWEVNSQWRPDPAVASEVEVTFFAEGVKVTRVELEHRKFEALGAESGEKMRGDVNGGWPGILELFKNEAEASAK
jgi:DNA-binding transcriptional ArsR family regulator/uncharacterized protein YndB with AHSA1/START domain